MALEDVRYVAPKSAALELSRLKFRGAASRSDTERPLWKIDPGSDLSKLH
jgi:hypothetical protein